MKPLLFLALPLALAACTPGQDEAAPPAAPLTPAAAPATPAAPAADAATTLTGHHWRLDAATAANGSRIDALFANPDAPLQLDFIDGRVSVSNACNRMGADYTLAEAGIGFGMMISTMMACPDPLMAMEREAHARLAGDHGFSLAAGDPPRMELVNAQGDRLAFVGSPTAQTRYGSTPERVFLEVAAARIECSHPMMPEYRCLNVRELQYDEAGLKRGEGEWQAMYQEIEGFEHRPGVRTVLRLDRYQRTDVPADASSLAYVLDMVVETEQVAASD